MLQVLCLKESRTDEAKLPEKQSSFRSPQFSYQEIQEFFQPTPTPPNQAFICIFSISTIPDNGIILSCIPFTEPLDVAVVETLHRAVAADPNLTSFPSMAPPLWFIPIAAICGLPDFSACMFTEAPIKYANSITPNML